LSGCLRLPEFLIGNASPIADKTSAAKPWAPRTPCR